MMFLGIIVLVIGFALLYKNKKYEMENVTDGGVVRHKSVMSGFGKHMLKVLGIFLSLVGLLVTVFSLLS